MRSYNIEEEIHTLSQALGTGHILYLVVYTLYWNLDQRL